MLGHPQHAAAWVRVVFGSSLVYSVSLRCLTYGCREPLLQVAYAAGRRKRFCKTVTWRIICAGSSFGVLGARYLGVSVCFCRLSDSNC